MSIIPSLGSNSRRIEAINLRPAWDTIVDARPAMVM